MHTAARRVPNTHGMHTAARRVPNTHGMHTAARRVPTAHTRTRAKERKTRALLEPCASPAQQRPSGLTPNFAPLEPLDQPPPLNPPSLVFALSPFTHSIHRSQVGGFAALMGSWAMGPRIGRFEGSVPVEIPGHSATLVRHAGKIRKKERKKEGRKERKTYARCQACIKGTGLLRVGNTICPRGQKLHRP
jgi:hypothetical protein